MTIEKIVLIIGATICHLCLCVGVLTASNNAAMYQNRHNDGDYGSNSTDSVPENAAFVELFRAGLMTVCCISLNWLLVVILIFG